MHGQIYVVKHLVEQRAQVNCKDESDVCIRALFKNSPEIYLSIVFVLLLLYTPRREMLFWPEVCCLGCMNEQLYGDAVKEVSPRALFSYLL